MNGKVKIALLVTGLCCVALLGLGTAEYEQAIVTGAGERVWHHELAAEADVTLGSTSIPDDFMVDGDFTSHLPLVIIDTHGSEIINYKHYDLETDSFVYQDGVDPYVTVTLSVCDAEDHVNRLSDVPTFSSEGKIKVRGNSSSTLAKKQYRLQLMDANGEKAAASLLGMTASDSWILNGTMGDRSYLRNYLALNVAGELDPYTPDIRMCEVVLKRDTGYEYMGLYGMYECIEQGEGRVDIEPVSNPIEISDQSYILQRDRREPDGYSMAVWSTEHQRSENWLNLEYPSAEKITDEYWEYIQKDIREIEDVLYSDKKEEFLRYHTLLNVDSFVNYFVINEFFANYDAGWNSTFLYKNQDGKVAIGPIWDFDGAMDNYERAILEINMSVFQEAPWFDRLITDEAFVDAVTSQYNRLRSNLLSNQNIQEKIEQAAAFLEYPAKRDRSRWDESKLPSHGVYLEEDTDLEIVRDRDSYEEEVERLEDVLLLHSEYLDKNLHNSLMQFVEHSTIVASLGGWLMITAFFVSIILVQRHRKGM